MNLFKSIINAPESRASENKAAEFNASSTMSALVNEELRLDSAFHPNLGGVTRGGMSNHYPMTILSLQGLGASDAQINTFRNAWPRHRARMQEDLGLLDSQLVQADNWTEFLGQPSYMLEFRRVFLEGLESSHTRQRYIATALGAMQDGLPMGLFHPMIKLSFACLHGDKGLIADALAYMAIRYFDLYQSDLSQTAQTAQSRAVEVKEISAQQNWQQIARTTDQVLLDTPMAIWQRGSLHISERLCAHPALQTDALDDGFDINHENLELRMEQISLSALRLYLFEPALTTLHAVTAVQALVDLTSRSQADSASQAVFVQLWRRYWIWLTALYLEKGAPLQLPDIDPAVQQEVDDADWQALAAQARQIPEVHLIKMVYSCKWLYEQVDSHPLYKLAAMNLVAQGNAHPRYTHGLMMTKLLHL